jgi:hypothetical protein
MLSGAVVVVLLALAVSVDGHLARLATGRGESRAVIRRALDTD